MGIKLMPYEWMMAQLHPELFFGSDVFMKMNIDVFQKCDLIVVGDMLLKRRKELDLSFHCFVDEAQILLKEYPYPLLRRIEGDRDRSMYSAVFAGFISNSRIWNTSLPVLAGIGMCQESLLETISESYAAKERHYQNTFVHFDRLSCEGVKRYMGIFADLSEESSSLVTHATKWLCGRPSFTATFLSLWMQGTGDTAPPINPNSSRLLTAIDCYVEALTALPGHDCSQWSKFLRHASLYALLGNVFYENASEYQEHVTLKTVSQRAILEYALSGKPVALPSNLHSAVRLGICAISSNNTLILEEPLIVEAGRNHLGGPYSFLKDKLNANDTSGIGLPFELWSLPFIKERFLRMIAIMNAEQKIPRFADDFRIGRSAY